MRIGKQNNRTNKGRTEAIGEGVVSKTTPGLIKVNCGWEDYFVDLNKAEVSALFCQIFNVSADDLESFLSTRKQRGNES